MIEIGVKKCAFCRKQFAVPYPQLWAYRQGSVESKKTTKWFCSWKCLRAAEKNKMTKNDEPDKKGDLNMNDSIKKWQSLSLEEQASILLDEIAAGRSPVSYMEKIGYANPGQSYMDVKKRIRAKHPELGSKFPARATGKKPTAAEAVKAMGKAADDFFTACEEAVPTLKVSGPIRIEAEKPEEVTINKPLMHSGKTAVGWEGDFGRYVYDRRHGYIDYASNDGEEISMPVVAWQSWLAEIREIGRLMGVEL